MIDLKKGVIGSILEGMSKGNTITPSDVEMFFEKSRGKVERMLEAKELCLRQVKERLSTFQIEVEATDSKTVINEILIDLVQRLDVALLDFKHRKQNKYDALIKQLKLAILAQKPPIVVKCLYDIQNLNNTLKDHTIVSLQQQIHKYSVMADEEGKVYLNFYERHEQKENLEVEVAMLSNEVQALQAILQTY